MVLFVYVTMGAFAKTFTRYARVTLTSDRSGCDGARGQGEAARVQVGEVGAINSGRDSISLTLNMYPDQLGFIPANVEVPDPRHHRLRGEVRRPGLPSDPVRSGSPRGPSSSRTTSASKSIRYSKISANSSTRSTRQS
jgi:hypothetical protein